MDLGQSLRRLAEERARAKGADQLEGVSLDEARRLVYELQVHQIELEMQNEDLCRTQAELEASRARYLDLYDLAPVGYFTLSQKGLILEVNLAAAKLLGATKGVLLNQPLSRFIVSEDQDIYYRHRKQLFETGTPRMCELRMTRADVAPFWAKLETTAAPDPEGVFMYRTVVSDITERMRANERLRESEERFRRLFDYHSAVMMVIDPDTGNIVDANQAAANFYGWPIEELKQMRIWQINTLSPEAVKCEMEKARSSGGDAF